MQEETHWSVVQAKAKLSELIRRSKETPQVIEADGQPVAVVVPFSEFEELKRLRGELVRQRRKALMQELAALNAEEDDAGERDFALPERLERPIPSLKED